MKTTLAIVLLGLVAATLAYPYPEQVDEFQLEDEIRERRSIGDDYGLMEAEPEDMACGGRRTGGGNTGGGTGGNTGGGQAGQQRQRQRNGRSADLYDDEE